MNHPPPSVRIGTDGLRTDRAGDAQRLAFQSVCALLGDRFDVEVSRVALESTLIDDLGIEAADIEYLALALEEAFGVDISSADVPRLLTVGDAVECVLRSRPSRTPGEPITRG